ncbi:TPA: DNA cytosine methyltransferase [Proteus mirabilis]|uniref:DNA cytosine methyltransferase n=1 Tax=Proteus mirabilis TaxID=584 RepID=UPI000D74FAA4|nr:DNA cytosine methyltransferase [Proteus mirabilis]AWR58721.1 cytosine methyltransferase [Proteus mirabilis]EMD5788628.1 DNA cytosine methyltransferase [Proteus mirabilis]HEJ9590999.1 DNA cytosine methyltransferase [Proteus mirabilis]HEJ9674601.1 DNA cytosine methyltransferase [Proteus mirabilis]HEK0450300.1 DNA cytosine methyltransferase [Proteus mirabilis]
MLNTIDLFSGGGGLSEGMRQAGFRILSAVELDHIAAETFKTNHKESVVIERDIRHVSASELLKQSGISMGQLDLLAGCPPCQGFSSLTRKYNRNDERNTLIKEVSRLVKDLKPKAIMIENVPGIMAKGKAYLASFIDELVSMGYIVNYDVLQVADYGVPQNRRRFVLLAGLNFEIKIPVGTHSRNGDNGLPKWITVKEALKGVEAPISLKNASSFGGPQKLNWNVIRDLSDLNIERLKYVKSGGHRYDIPDHLRPKCHQGNNTGFGNVYARMSWDEPSPTITGGCTVLSKGRYGHPSELRTISVREAARLQTFPDSYKFATDLIDQACQIIGNALPCEFARVMSQACYDALSNLDK